MSENPKASSTSCWNCQQPLQAGSVRCLFCGVAQVQATQFVVAPGGPSAASPASVVAPRPAPVAAQRQAPGAQATPTTSAVAQRTPRGKVSLAPEFSGSVASVGARIVAVIIDLSLIVGLTVAVTIVTGQLIFGAIALVEAAIGTLVLEARTGVTIGKALFRLRTARDDAPFSPGIGRAFVRQFVTGLGLLAGGVGVFFVIATSAFDPSRKGRSIADRAARTVVVAAPRKVAAPRQTLTYGEAPAGVTIVGDAPTPVADIGRRETPLILAAPQVVSTLARPASIDEDSASASRTGAGGAAFAGGAVPLVAEVAAPSSGSSNGDQPRESSGTGTLLLVFDTGQREQLPIPVAVNLGRNPSKTEATDQQIVINDPESTVSKTHLRLEHSRGNTWVTDGGSTNGTDLLLDDGTTRRLKKGERVLLDEGARVRVGNRAFTVSVLLESEK
jgi:uncharacterized RDD family membrane protein YckC